MLVTFDLLDYSLDMWLRRIHISFCPILAVDLIVFLGDLLLSSHVTDIFLHWFHGARDIFPHLTCLGGLLATSGILPASEAHARWCASPYSKREFGYPDASALRRKIVSHAGSSNGGIVTGAYQPNTPVNLFLFADVRRASSADE